MKWYEDSGNLLLPPWQQIFALFLITMGKFLFYHDPFQQFFMLLWQVFSLLLHARLFHFKQKLFFSWLHKTFTIMILLSNLKRSLWPGDIWRNLFFLGFKVIWPTIGCILVCFSRWNLGPMVWFNRIIIQCWYLLGIDCASKSNYINAQSFHLAEWSLLHQHTSGFSGNMAEKAHPYL